MVWVKNNHQMLFSAKNVTHQQDLQLQGSADVLVVLHHHGSVEEVPTACHVDLDPTASKYKKEIKYMTHMQNTT